jgi:hypothetical protein
MSDLLNSASLVMIPSGYKEDTVYSVVPSDGSGDLTLTRASNGTRVNSLGLVEDVPWNLLQQSETFDNGIWGILNSASVSANTTTAPNGTTTADTLTFSANSSSTIYQSISSPAGETTLSIYAKTASGTKQFRLRIDEPGGNASSDFTATTEWQRFEFNLTTSSAGVNFYIINDNAGTAGSMFIWGAQLNIGATAKPYFPTTDRLNVPRLTYQNGGGGCPSLLLEKQSTNGLYPSEDFSTTWSLYNSATVTTNQATSPDGTQNADKLTTTNQATALYNVNGAGASAQAYTASLFIKYIDNTEFAIGMTDDVTGEAFARFNFTTGTATTTLQGDWTSITYAWEQQANGWYRISVTATKGASGNARFIGKGGGAYNYYIWGAQVEAGSYKTSYIPTTSSSATRVVDACSKTGISSLIGQTEGVMFVQGSIVGSDSLISNLFAALEKTSSGATMRIFKAGTSSGYSGNKIIADIFNGSTFSAQMEGPVIAAGQTVKAALAYKANDFAFAVNGVIVATDNSGTVPATDDLKINTSIYSNMDAGVHLSQTILFPTRLSNSDLIALTTI